MTAPSISHPLPTIHVYPDAAALADGVAGWIAVALARAVAERGHASIALAGGTTPRALHARLTDGDLAPPIDWDAITIWFGDERCVPADDPASNVRMARETLVDHVRIAPDRVIRIEGELPPAEAARRYHQRLAAAPPLDVIVLGMGDDGHVASWFPGGPPFADGALAAATVSPKPPHDRVTITPAAIARAHDVALVVSGAGKAARLAAVYAELRAGAPALPAALVTSASGPPRWFVDEAAAAGLPPSHQEER